MVSKIVTSLSAEQSLLQNAILRLLVNAKKKDIDTLTLEYFEERLQTVKQHAESVHKIHAKLLSEVSEENRPLVTYFSTNVFEDILDAIDDATDFCLVNINRIHGNKLNNASNTTSNATSSLVKLPTLQLPKFSGSYTEWSNFRDLFKTTIHDNHSITGVQKLQYLKSCLSGEAAEIVKTYSISNENYTSAWNAIRQRFENKKIIKTALLNQLFNIPTVSNSSLSSICKLYDTYKQVLESMRNLDSPIEESSLLVHFLVQRFDSALKREWEIALCEEKDYPSLAAFDDFIMRKIRTLEALTLNVNNSSHPVKPNKLHSFNTTNRDIKCPYCKASHRIYSCSKFMQMSPGDRQSFSVTARLCTNCLAAGHKTSECSSKYRCKTCSRSHHSLLHFSDKPVVNSSAGTSTSKEQPAKQISSLCNSAPAKGVLLATALATVTGPTGKSMPVRALLDIGSETSFVSESVAQFLHLPRCSAKISVAGIGGQQTTYIKHSTSLKINALNSEKNSIEMNAYILPQITTYIPRKFNIFKHRELRKLHLADPHTSNTGKVDILIGADIYGQIITGKIIRLSSSSVVAQHTIFGWVLSGPIHKSNSSNTSLHTHHLRVSEMTQLSDQLEKFWQTEEVPSASLANEEEEFCENHFVTTHKRDEHGRYIVRLPFKKLATPSEIGDSRRFATGSFNNLQRQFLKWENLSELYCEFMSEYIQLGHMSKVSEDNAKRTFLPHHAVLKEQGTSTKIRVVFNASCPTTSGKTLNNLLCIGPKLQNDIVSIISNWRFHKYVMVADIEKMFRQILVAEEDRRFQCILWGDKDAPSTYELNTVTYGTAPAPYLAMRAIKQLIYDEGESFPLAVEFLKNQIYVDDILFGAADETSLLKIKDQIISLLGKGGFILKKWASNLTSLFDKSSELHLQNPDALDQKVLGISWSPDTDTFSIKINLPSNSTVTKRIILSTVGKIFDPLGWLSPIVIKAKILLQELWATGLHWDDQLPDHLLKNWATLCQELPNLESLKLPRWIHYDSTSSKIQLIGFSDASRQAYSATVYVRTSGPNGEIYTSLLIAKSKVAPIKTLSIPRLELCGAVLLSKLIDYARNNLVYNVDELYCFTDSQIVLSWLARPPSTWQTYVANRVSFIQTTLPNVTWHHVISSENSADLNSRGISVENLLSASLWWNGPKWLSTDLSFNRHLPGDTTEELRKARPSTLHQHTPEMPFYEKHSTWTKLLNITAYLFKVARLIKTPNMKNSVFNLLRDDLRRAKVYLIKQIQLTTFSDELQCLSKGRSIAKSSPLIKLSPFLDDEGIIRVGGRLEHATELSFEQKHPIILSNHHITRLILTYFHKFTLHGGLQLTLQVLRNQYWVLNARNLTKTIIRECIVCVRQAAKLSTQKMSSLPEARCSISRAFSHVGVDYAGPFAVRHSKGRGHQARKTYIAVFVCFSTRAIHLEAVTDYSSAGFLAALQRFIARRGCPDTIYSDNGTNFQGANSELRRAFKGALRDPNLHNYFSAETIAWEFIPPSAPHFGGLWEAGVKSVKYHLKRVIGAFTPTLEEFITILCRIEACLNSRPLCRIGDDVEDLNVLTPGHFLVGSALKAPVEPSYLDLGENRLSRWQILSKITQQFWKRWSTDYLQSMQTRNKWHDAEPPLQVGDIVIIRDPNLPPTKWMLAKVEKVHDSKDRLIRVVTVKTANTTLIRPITQVCKLPTHA